MGGMAVDNAGEIVEYNGRPAVVLSNGTLQDLETRKFVHGNPPGASRITTTERAVELNHTRWHAGRQEALRKAVERATGDSMPDVGAADATIIADMVESVVLDVNVRGDHRVKAAQWVYEQSGMDGRAPRGTAQVSPSEAVAIGAGTAAALLLLAEQEIARRDVVDGQVRDA